MNSNQFAIGNSQFAIGRVGRHLESDKRQLNNRVGDKPAKFFTFFVWMMSDACLEGKVYSETTN
jgi:hypothetical protein